MSSRHEYAGALYPTEAAAIQAAIYDWATAGGINDTDEALAALTTQEGIDELNASGWLDVWDREVEVDDQVVIDAVEQLRSVAR